MKKKTIWTIAIIMGLSFAGLLYLQFIYIRSMTRMKREQFDESVKRALYQASRNLELNETLRYLEKDVNAVERREKNHSAANGNVSENDSLGQHTHQFSAIDKNGNVYSSFELKTLAVKPAGMPKGIILNNDKKAISEASKSMQEIIHNRYVYKKALLDEVVYSILYTAANKPLKERINFKMLDQDLKAELMNNGISIPYHFTVSTSDGREVYRCPDYEDEGSDVVYTQPLFRNDPQTKVGAVKVHFPNMGGYIFDSIRFVIPSFAFTIVLFVTFLFTLFVVFRQKKLSEIKNDFINNMTHELKTPISSISLASQMLNDPNLAKSETMLSHLGGVISSESKRLRFLVEKVLQMSMFDKQKAIYNRKDVDINEMLETIAKTFQLRVEHTDGHIITCIEAVDSTVNVDEMHFQNVIFNLMDNAVKYSKPDRPLELFVQTWNPDEKHVSVMVKDNGLGIKKENLNKIFDKFYRVHTGNVHNVKGFGLGLAYVKKIVDVHGGTIKTESEYGKGTSFTITIPIVADE